MPTKKPLDRHITIGHTGDGATVALDVPTLVDSRGIITASSGGGKSYLLRKMIERIGAAALAQPIIIDPEGEFATLREKLDLLLVGSGGEVAVEVRTARKLAHRLAELRIGAVIDLYDLGDWPERRAWVAEFLSGLMGIPKDLYHPMVVVIDEAHKFAPEGETGKAGSPLALCRAAVNSLMSAGRKRAICGLLATQRISKLAKDSIGDAKNVFIGGVTLDIDQARAGDMLGLGKADRLALRDLAPGEFYAYGPAFESRQIFRFKVDPVETTHPKAGERHLVAMPPASSVIKDIVASLADLPAEVAAEEDERARLTREVADLRRQLAERPRPLALPIQPAAVVEKVEVPVFVDGEVGRLEAAARRLDTLTNDLDDLSNEMGTFAEKVLGALAQAAKASSLAARPVRIPVATGPTAQEALSRPRQPKPSKDAGNGAHGAPAPLGKAERAILTVLFQRGPLAKNQIAVRSGYSVKSSTFDNALSRLRSLGYITGSGERIEHLAEAEDAMPEWTPLPTGRGLLDYWLGKLGKAERAALEAVVGEYPRGLPKFVLADMAGYSSTSSTFDNALSRLRTLELITRGNDIRASEELFDA